MNYTQCGSALALPYADGIAQVCVTSPPYYGLRVYLPSDHPSKAQELGTEQSPAAYVAQIVAAMREVWRVLRDDGTLWLNLGDSYANDTKWGGTTGGKHVLALHGEPIGRAKRTTGLKAKDLMGIPWRVAFALQDDGWYLRSDIIWAKPNPMPESVTDRPTKAHEYVFLLAKQPRYFYDAEAISEPAQPFHAGGANDALDNPKTPTSRKKQDQLGKNTYTGFNDRWAESGGVATRNARSVWNIATQPYSGAHFATMPPELARRCILAGTSARGQCPKCGAPWHRVIEKGLTAHDGETDSAYEKGTTANRLAKLRQAARERGEEYSNGKVTTGWAASCTCEAGDPVPQLVLDPFMGSGTTAMCALQAGRRAIGTELNPAYLRLQDDRTQVTMGLGF